MKEIAQAFLIDTGNVFFTDNYGMVLYQDGTHEYLDYTDFLSALNKSSGTIEIQTLSREKFEDRYRYLRDEFNHFVSDLAHDKDKKARIIGKRMDIDLDLLYDLYDYHSLKRKGMENLPNQLDFLIDKCFKIASTECRRSGISYSEDNEEIVENILKKLDTKDTDYFTKRDISFCTSSEKVFEEYNGDITSTTNVNEIDDVARKYRYIKLGYLTTYASSFLGSKSDFLLALVDNQYPNRDLVLKNWTEFFHVCRDYFGIIDAVNQCSIDAENLKTDFEITKLESNKKFMDDLELLLKHNPDEETYYFHATNSRKSAQNILDKGLYMYDDDLSSTTYPELDKEAVLSYEYGNGLGNNATYVVVLKGKEGTNIVRNTTDKEKKESVGISRRMALTSEECNYIVDPENIVGFVDRKREEVVFNKMVKKDTNFKESKI